MKTRILLIFILNLILCISCNAQSNGSFATLKIRENVLIQIKRIHIHAFLAEYDRFLILTVGGKTIAELKISTDTGGYSRANIFSTKSDSIFVVQDRMGKYEININSRKIKEIENNCKNSKNSNFIGAFDTDESKMWQFISVSKRRRMPMLVSGCPGKI